MTTLEDLRETLMAVDITREVLSAIGRTSKEYINLNKDQLLDGKRADGSNMPNYSYISQTVFGKPDAPIMLYDTGAFHESMKLDVGGDELEILAEDVHGLEDRFGNEIYGLGDTNQEFYNQDIFFPELMEAIEALTGLKSN